MVATAFWGLLGTAAALSMIRIEKALDFSYVVASILGGGLLGLFLLAFFDRRAHARGVYAGLIAGIAVTTWGTLDRLIELSGTGASAAREPIFPLSPLLLVTLANLASLGVGFVASRVLPDGRAGPAGDPTVWDGLRSAGASDRS
jgi:Na+/proline symporter